MSLNAELVTINDALFVRDEVAIQDAVERVQRLMEETGSQPSWGWNNLITKSTFEVLGSKCRKCQSRWKLLTKGLFGCECACSNCYDANSKESGLVGQGPTIEDSVRDWNRAQSEYEANHPAVL